MIDAQRSPNHGPRRGGALPDLIVLHYTGMQSCAAAHGRLCDPASEVSAHYLISESGTVWQLVAESQRAWHAGAGAWGGVDDVNSRSIGIELANPGTHPFCAPQMRALETLLADIMQRWSMPAHRVIGHADMAPARKADPGPRFDWRALACQGLSIWPRPGDAQAPLQGSLTRFGYPDAPADARLRAFRARFRPWASGPEDATDRALADDLAQRFPAAAAGD